MLDSVLHILEVSAKFGFTDLILAAGLFGGITRLLRPRTVKNIDGLEVLVCLVDDKFIEIEIRNLTHETVYIYRPYFKRGHYANILNWKRPTSVILFTWSTTDAPKIAASEPCNYAGLYLLEAVDAEGNRKAPPFIEQRGSMHYRLQLEPTDKQQAEVLTRQRVGELTLHMVHGREAKTLQVQL